MSVVGTTSNPIWYCTREDVKSALDIKSTAFDNSRVDRAVGAASLAIEGQMHRKFYPTHTTKYFDWPSDQDNTSYRLWLDENEIISADSFDSGGTALVEGDDYNLEPVNYGPPFNRVEINRGSNASFNSGSSTPQRSLAITGLFGYNADESLTTSLNGGLNSTTPTVTVDSGAGVGVGALVRVGDERMVVTDRAYVDSAIDTTVSLAAQNSITSVAVGTGSNFTPGELIMIDAEVMLVLSVVGNTLLVRRAWDGSVLASHNTGANVYASRQLTVLRGVLGTSGIIHTDTDGVYVQQYPALIRQLAIAYASNFIQNDGSGWAGSAGSADKKRNQSLDQIAGLIKTARAQHGRKGRVRAI